MHAVSVWLVGDNGTYPTVRCAVNTFEESDARVRQARENALDQTSPPSTAPMSPAGAQVRTDIATSWRRCHLTGVEATGEAVPYNPEFDRPDRLVRAATSVIDRLAEQLTDCPGTIMLADAEAQIVDRRAGEQKLLRALDKAFVAPGFHYAEEFTGTNGIGSALEERRPFFVQGAEHYRENLLEFACMGAPIVHPVTGSVEGVLDVTCRFDETNVLMKPMVVSAIREIESRLYADASLKERTLLEGFLRASNKTTSAVASLGPDFIISNNAAAQLLDTSDQALLWDWATRMLTNRDEYTGQVRLSQDIVVQARVTRVGEGRNMAGVLIEMRRRQPSATTAGSRKSVATSAPRRDAHAGRDTLPGRSAASARLRREVDAVLDSALPVLVCGEHGAGKLFLTQHLHNRWHPQEACTVLDGRAAQCDSASWLERFTSRVEVNGTLVLRHLDELPADLCPPVLAQLQAGTGHARLVATAHARGEHGPAARLLDMFPTSLTVPPLRHRVEDIADIAPQILKQRTNRAPAPRLQPTTLQTLTALDWPGNIRELEAALSSAVVQSMGADITQAHLPPEYRSPSTRHRPASLERSERDTILQALADVDGNKLVAAKQLGIARSTLYRKMRALGIDDHRLAP